MRQAQPSSYGIVLLLIVADVAFIAASSGRGWSYVVIVALQGVTLLACLRAAHLRPMPWRVAAFAVLLAVLSVASSRIGAGADPGVFARLVNTALVALAPVVIAHDLWSHPRVTSRTVAGALCVYLLLGMVFATVYGVIGSLAGHAHVLAGVADPSEADRLYFSFTTMTTTGFGDFVPAPGAARAAAVLEALTGQLYLVTVVAVLVGRVGPLRGVGGGGP
jgi:Ion channel